MWAVQSCDRDGPFETRLYAMQAMVGMGIRRIRWRIKGVPDPSWKRDHVGVFLHEEGRVARETKLLGLKRDALAMRRRKKIERDETDTQHQDLFQFKYKNTAVLREGQCTRVVDFCSTPVEEASKDPPSAFTFAQGAVK